MYDLKNEPWMQFAENMYKELIEHGAEQAICVMRNVKEDRVTVNQFNCDFEMRCIMIGHLLDDLVVEIITNNADLIREILSEDEEEK